MTPSPPNPNPFSPILEAIAAVGINVSPIPVNSAYEFDPDRQTYRWTVDVDVRIPYRHSFDLCGAGITLEDAIRRALYMVKRELPKCQP